MCRSRSDLGSQHNRGVTPVEVLRLWFDAHARGDLVAASELVVDDVEITLPGTRVRGFDEFMRWYRDRAQAEGASFSYEVEDVLAGDSYAAAVLTLSADGRSWRQLALYGVEGDRISSIWAAEDAA